MECVAAVIPFAEWARLGTGGRFNLRDKFRRAASAKYLKTFGIEESSVYKSDTEDNTKNTDERPPSPPPQGGQSLQPT